MKISDIYESTTSGAIATVAQPMTGATQKRSTVGKGVYANQKPGNLLTGKKTNKKFANSLHEGKMKEIASDLDYLDNLNFQKKYKATKEQIRARFKIQEAQLEEDDLILVPGQGHRLKTGFHSFDPDKAEHEGETLKNSLRTISRNAKELYDVLENCDSIPEWVSEKVGQIKGMMTNVNDYMVSKKQQSEGVIAAGGVGENQEHFDHEISMAKSEMRSAAKAAKRIYQMLDERDELMAWQQSYITLASDYLGSVADSMEEELSEGKQGGEKEVQDYKKWRKDNHDDLGTTRKIISREPSKGSPWQDMEDFGKKVTDEGAKVDRMVKHIAKSEREAGKPAKKATDIAWAMVNKRGYLDNKNKKG
jgi:hypothetical protein